MLVLSEEARSKISKPFGPLFSDFLQLIPQINGKFLCTVGDVVTKNAINAGFVPSISVVDGITKRCEIVSDIKIPDKITTLHVKNAPGTISDELIVILRESMKKTPAMVIVDGEEDLAVIPLLEILPDDSVLLYGQPNEGVVLCEVNPQLRSTARNAIEFFTHK